MRPQILVLLAMLALAPSSGRAETPPKVSLSLPKSAKVGAKVQATLTITIEEGLHLYQNPPTKDYMIPLEIVSASKGIVAKPRYPKGTVRDFLGEPTAMYDGTIEVPVEIIAPKKPGPLVVKLDVRYQQCTNESCYPPGSVTVSGKMTLKKP